MILVFLKYPHMLDEAPGLGDPKTATPPRRDDYVSLLTSRSYGITPHHEASYRPCLSVHPVCVSYQMV